MAELVYVYASGAYAVRLEGSSPSAPTICTGRTPTQVGVPAMVCEFGTIETQHEHRI